MNSEIKENLEENLRLKCRDLSKSMDQQYQAMLSMHAAKGLLHSGATIKKTMEFIVDGSSEFYEASLSYMRDTIIDYSNNIEFEYQSISEKYHVIYFNDAIEWLQKAAQISSHPELYERMLPEVEADVSSNKAKFQNLLNREILKVKNERYTPKWVKVIYGIEIILLLATALLCGMWIKDPEGNYEPIIIALALVIPLLFSVVKFRSNSNLTKLA